MRLALTVIAAVVLATVAAMLVAVLRWRAGTREALGRLGAGLAPGGPATYSDGELAGLPSPVQRYFRLVLRDGQRIVRRAVLKQEGEFLLDAARNRWAPFTATETFVPVPAGFVWDARIAMAPGLAVFVRDGFVAGHGSMRGAVLGLLTMVHDEGTPQVASGALYRYLAETPWLPTALLPSQGVTWSSLDDRSARATLTAGGITVAADFHFGDDGLVEQVTVAERERVANGKVRRLPWRGRYWAWAERDGMRVPTRGEVEWVLPEGPQPYWRGTITASAFEY